VHLPLPSLALPITHDPLLSPHRIKSSLALALDTIFPSTLKPARLSKKLQSILYFHNVLCVPDAPENLLSGQILISKNVFPVIHDGNPRLDYNEKTILKMTLVNGKQMIHGSESVALTTSEDEFLVNDYCIVRYRRRKEERKQNSVQKSRSPPNLPDWAAYPAFLVSALLNCMQCNAVRQAARSISNIPSLLALRSKNQVKI